MESGRIFLLYAIISIIGTIISVIALILALM
jgi:hypothetical protein